MRGLRLTRPRTRVLRMRDCAETELRMRALRMKDCAEKESKMKELRMRELVETDRRTIDLRGRDFREADLRMTDPRAREPRETDLRMRATDRTDLQETDISRGTVVRKAVFRITAAGGITAAVMAGIREARAIDRSADNSSQEEAMVRMPERRETDRADRPDFRDLAGRALAVVRLIGAVRALVRVLTVISTVVRAIIAEMADREPDSEIISRVRASQERLRQRIWKRSARKKRGVLTARRRGNAPRRTISMRKTKH